jgi:hypothetical protein
MYLNVLSFAMLQQDGWTASQHFQKVLELLAEEAKLENMRMS